MQHDTQLAGDAPGIDDDGTPGWDAINDAMAGLYPGQEPKHFGAVLPWTLGGDNPLDGISVYWSALPRPHWHYVTYGFSELFGKQSDDLDVSGYGFEMTFRLRAPSGAGPASTPPAWPMNLLQNLARYVFETGNVFEQGHHMNANGPIALEHDTALRHIAFMHDPQLPPRGTANGRLEFLQVVGLTDGEMAAILRWSADSVLQVLEPALPLWITDLDRSDLLQDPVLAARIDDGSRSEGSSTAVQFAETLDWTQRAGSTAVELVIGAGQVLNLLQLLPMRLPFGQPLELSGRERSWTFQPGAADSVRVDGQAAYCTLTDTSMKALLQQLQPQRGHYPLGDGSVLSVQVQPTTLRDGRGAPVRTVG